MLLISHRLEYPFKRDLVALALLHKDSDGLVALFMASEVGCQSWLLARHPLDLPHQGDSANVAVLQYIHLVDIGELLKLTE